MNANEWTVLPVTMSDDGTVARMQVNDDTNITVNVAAFNGYMRREQLRTIIGDPFDTH